MRPAVDPNAGRNLFQNNGVKRFFLDTVAVDCPGFQCAAQSVFIVAPRIAVYPSEERLRVPVFAQRGVGFVYGFNQKSAFPRQLQYRFPGEKSAVRAQGKRRIKQNGTVFPFEDFQRSGLRIADFFFADTAAAVFIKNQTAAVGAVLQPLLKSVGKRRQFQYDPDRRRESRAAAKNPRSQQGGFQSSCLHTLYNGEKALFRLFFTRF